MSRGQMAKKLQLGLIVGIITMVMAMGNSWAMSNPKGCDSSDKWPHALRQPGGCSPNPNGCDPSGQIPRKCIKTPEIDAGAGSGALALLIGGLLLAAEKRRRCS